MGDALSGQVRSCPDRGRRTERSGALYSVSSNSYNELISISLPFPLPPSLPNPDPLCPRTALTYCRPLDNRTHVLIKEIRCGGISAWEGKSKHVGRSAPVNLADLP